MTNSEMQALKDELSIKCKNGVDFITAATIVWFLIGMIWTLSYTAYDKSVLTFIIGGVLLPLAFGLSKVYKTQWKIPENPLSPLGLWLNFAQLFYFPFLVFILIKSPEYFVMTYAIITGAHFFPYAWFYDEKAFSIAAGVIAIGSMALGLTLSSGQMYLLPLLVSVALGLLAVALYLSAQRKTKTKEVPQ